MWKTFLLLLSVIPLVYSVCVGCYGYINVNVNNPKVREAATVATKFFSDNDKSKFHHKLIEILNGQQSLCSVPLLCGEFASYRLNATVGLTNCLKDEVMYENIEDCDLQKNAKTLNCKFNITKDKKGQIKSTHSSCLYLDTS